MSVRCLFGTETEYAVIALNENGDVLPTAYAVARLRARAVKRPNLPAAESGVFLSNGGRFYVDVGNHPEYAAPETTDPWEAVRYSFAGDRLMAELAAEAALDAPRSAAVHVRKGNVDYTTRATWGSHENFLHERPPTVVRPSLVSHLVSRIVFTGGGGFDPFAPDVPRFVLSPRALFVQCPIGGSMTGRVALVDDRFVAALRAAYLARRRGQ